MLDLALKASEDHPLEKLACKASRGVRSACSSLGDMDMFVASAVRHLLLSAIRLESAIV